MIPEHAALPLEEIQRRLRFTEVPYCVRLGHDWTRNPQDYYLGKRWCRRCGQLEHR